MKQKNEENNRDQSNIIDQYQLLMSQTQELILFFSSDGKIQTSNQSAEMELGYKKEEMKQINIADIYRKSFTVDEGRINLSEEISKLESGFLPYETVAYRKNNTCFYVMIQIVLPSWEHQYGVCTATSLVSLQNVKTELKMVREELEQAQKIKIEFIANITHELRTPLNGMIGLTKNLMQSQLDYSQLDNVRIIDICCSNMVKIINDLLDFSKMEAGKITFEERIFNFREFLKGIETLNENLVNEKGIRLDINVDEDIPDYLVGDELRIGQILNNLIGNAIKFTSVGQIAVEVIKTVENNEFVELFFMVIDSGIGIDEKEKDKLFKSFSQVDASITRKFGGTGLGLAICKELVNLMHGKINVESEKGKGSTFSFSIRLKSAKQQDSADIETNNQNTSLEQLEGFQISEKRYDVIPDYAFRFSTKMNMEEIMNAMEKLILCIELGTWYKAEMFAGIIKKLISKDDFALRRQAFRIELSVRKEDYNQSIELYDEMQIMLDTFEE